ncbi:MAG: winged helix-turn-helix domain-containing protein [Candidatus Aenigmatarchaeota archaeon]
MEEPVTILDRDVLRVLAVETRMDIIKELSQGSRTPSDLSKKLNKSDATIVEHLDALVKAGLVSRTEQPGKKWVFYTLTDRGKGIVSSKSRRLIIILSTSILAIAGGIFSFTQYFTQPQYSGLVEKATETAPTVGSVAEAPTTTIFPYLYVGIVLAVIGIIGVGFYLYKKLYLKVRML